MKTEMDRNYIPLWIWRSLAHAVEEGTEKWQNGGVVGETFEKENEAKWFGAAAAAAEAEAGAVAGAFLATFFPLALSETLFREPRTKAQID